MRSPRLVADHLVISGLPASSQSDGSLLVNVLSTRFYLYTMTSTPYTPIVAPPTPPSVSQQGRDSSFRTAEYDKYSPLHLGSHPCTPGQLPRTPRGQYTHCHDGPFLIPYSGGSAFDYLTPPPSLRLNRVPGYAYDTHDSDMLLAGPRPRETSRQFCAVPVAPPAMLPTSRVTSSSTTECAQNIPYLLLSQSSAPNLSATEQPSATLYSPPSIDSIKDHALMPVTPHSNGRHGPYAHMAPDEEHTVVAPVPISASSRTVVSLNYAHVVPSDALGLDIGLQRAEYLYDEYAGDASQEAGPSTLSDPPQSRWSQRLRRLAPPPVQVPPTESRFAWTSGSRMPGVEGGQADEEPQDISPPSYSPSPLPPPDECAAAQGQAAEPSQCSTIWASSDAVPQLGASRSQDSLQQQSTPYEDRLGRAAGIYAGQKPTSPRPSSPRHPPPVRRRAIPLPPVTVHPTEYVRRPPTDPSSSHPFAVDPSLWNVAAARPSASRTRQHETQDEPMEVDQPERAGLSPLDIHFQRAPFADWEDITSRCVQAVDDMRYVLGSCALISLNETNVLIDSLTAAINTIRATMMNAPGNALELEEAHGQGFSHKYSDLLSSLTRNMDMLYLQADHVRDRPPRINKIDSVLDKFWRYVEKIEDLGRRLQKFHDHAGILHLHDQLRNMSETAEAETEAERARRRMFEEGRAQARAHRREVRDEIRRTKEAAQARRERSGSTKTQRADAGGGHSPGV